MKLVLNGWQRLWVLASTLLLLPIAVVTVSTFPALEHVAHQSVFEINLSSDARSKLVAPDEKGIIWDDLVGLEVKMPNGHILRFKKGVKNDIAKTVGSEYYDVLKREANKERLLHITTGVLWWLVAIFSIYALGWAVGWVYKGFRKSP